MDIYRKRFGGDGAIRIKGEMINGRFMYRPVIGLYECSCVAETEDMAMLLGLGIKYDGPNTQFPKMSARMLNINTTWKD